MTMTPTEIMLMTTISSLRGMGNVDERLRKSAINRLKDSNLIEHDSSSPSGYMPTERGNVFVEMLCSTPLPQSVFIDPRTLDNGPDG